MLVKASVKLKRDGAVSPQSFPRPFCQVVLGRGAATDIAPGGVPDSIEARRKSLKTSHLRY
jgi:hypothetical protein